ncbi:carbohydrate porin [Alteromonas sp. CYL-A6]|uniref:carbohydrate porin n=1 Tax=Alteromonas nitratireducens TaxID=3390813 RepID=UPI0034A70235
MKHHVGCNLLHRLSLINRIWLYSFLLIPSSLASVGSLDAFLASDNSIIAKGSASGEVSSRVLAGVGYTYTLNENWRARIAYQAFRGSDGSVDTEDIQVYSNIDSTPFTSLYGLFIEGSVQDNRLRMKVGQFDANTEFAFSDIAAGFINSSMGFSPTITFLPTYPVPTPGLAVFFDISDNLNFSAATFSSENDRLTSPFFISELGYRGADSVFKAGIWQQELTADVTQSHTSDSFTGGVFITAEGVLTKHSSIADTIEWFFQFGASEKAFNPLTRHVGTGLVFHEPAGFQEHSLGVGITHVTGTHNDDTFGHSKHTDETSVEVYYAITLNDHVIVKPDIQYILSPALAADDKDVLVATLRIELSL